MMTGASGTHGCPNKGVTVTLAVKGEETLAELKTHLTRWQEVSKVWGG